MSNLEANLAALQSSGLNTLLQEAQCGLEKEALRVDVNGLLSQAGHPRELGSALTHPAITTDFSEALLELITPVFQSPDAALDSLHALHRVAQNGISDELLWATSMPCRLPADQEIPIAEYGTSNSGMMRKVYRNGLSWRYGRSMQTIAGIHYNFSPSDTFWDAWQDHCGNLDNIADFRSDWYFSLIRNFRRHVWLLVYLFGASPAVCRSFLQGQEHGLEAFTDDTFHLPWATSLRMSGLGYQNNAQSVVNICYNTLDSYVASLRHATSTPHDEFTRIGVRVDGEYRQLNDNILQIENEYYSAMRPKRTVRRGERPLLALSERGVEYVEVRCTDINPYSPMGIDSEQAHFLHVFLWYCLLADSPAIDETECARISENLRLAVYRGREPGLELALENGPVSLTQAGLELLDELEAVAETIEQGGDSAWSESARAMRERLENPQNTPSGRVVEDMRRNNLSHLEFGLDASRQHADWLGQSGGTQDDNWSKVAEKSFAELRDLEAAQGVSFEEYLQAYFRQ